MKQTFFQELQQGISDIRTVTIDEFKRIFSDSGVLLLFVGAILFYPLIYAYIYDNEIVEDVPIAIVDHSGTGLSRQFTEMLDATQQVKVASMSPDLFSARDDLYAGDIHGIVLIPKDFSKKIKQGEQTTISIFADVSSFMYYKQLLQAAQVVSQTLGKGVVIKKMMSSKGITSSQAMQRAIPIDYIDIPLYNTVGGYATYLMPPLLLMILQQILLMGIGMLGGTLAEKNAYHYLLPYAVKRRGSIRITIAKGLAYFTIFLTSSFYLVVIVFRWLQLAHRTPITNLLIFLIPFILAVTFLGLVLASFFKNRENALLFLLFSSIPMLFLSGFSWPEQEWLSIFKWMSFLPPSTWAIKGFTQLSQMGASLHDVWREWFVLWGMAIVCFIATAIRFKMIIRSAKERAEKQIEEQA